MGARGRTPDSGSETANPFNEAGRETPKIPLSGTGIIRGKGTEANTGDRKTSGRVGELKEVGLPARWAVFPAPGRGFPAKKGRFQQWTLKRKDFRS